MRIETKSSIRVATVLFTCLLCLGTRGKAQATGSNKMLELGCQRVDFKAVGRLGPNLSGCITGVDQSKGPVRVRLADLRSSRVFKIKTGKFSEFSLNDVPDGEYVLLVTQGDHTIALRRLSLPLVTKPVVLDLNSYIDVPRVEY